MSRAELAIGLANTRLANTIWDDLQNITGTTNALSLGATLTSVGVSGGTVGFYGITGSSRQTLASSSNTTQIVAALAAIGLVQ